MLDVGEFEDGFGDAFGEGLDEVVGGVDDGADGEFDDFGVVDGLADVVGLRGAFGVDEAIDVCDDGARGSPFLGEDPEAGFALYALDGNFVQNSRFFHCNLENLCYNCTLIKNSAWKIVPRPVERRRENCPANRKIITH